ncbi:MAG: chemotaxis protein CheW [Methylobacteriaceae bacterium]|nr:chemotaxis protein CheW [Methylobacteriaceae bacterium]
MDELLSDFVAETAERIEAIGGELVRFEHSPDDTDIIANVFRLVHTIKGTCGFLGLSRLAELSHAAEGLLGLLRDGAAGTAEIVSVILATIDRLKLILNGIETLGAEPPGDDADLIADIEARATELAGAGGNSDKGEEHGPVARTDPGSLSLPWPATEAPRPVAPIAEAPSMDGSLGDRRTETIRVSVGTLEQLMALVSELVLTRNQLLELVRHRDEEPIKGPVQRLASVTTELQHGVMKARMQPVARLFAGVPRLIRELTSELGKSVSLVTMGAETELDRQLIELIRDPLTHMIRNAVDHGIEPPDMRRAQGKPASGTIRILAMQDSGQFVIEVSDDGRGIDIDRVRRKALALGLATEAELAAMSEEVVTRYILAPGFSTADKVTSVSGRGVGMDVVRRDIEAIGGLVGLRSGRGRGTTVTLRIPLTLAIAPALVIEVDGDFYALPQHCVVEVIGISEEAGPRVELVQGAPILRLRDTLLPVADLGDILGLAERSRPRPAEHYAVTVGIGSTRFGVIVDAIADVQEIVVKPLPQVLAGLPLYSGNTILGDGSVALILDPTGLARAVGLQGAELQRAAAMPSEEQEIVQAESRVVLFRAGGSAPKALPLSAVARIDRVTASEVSVVDGLRVVYRGDRLMPLVPVDATVELKPQGPTPILVVDSGETAIGLIVEEIIDVIDGRAVVELSGRGAGVIGMADIAGRATEIIDVGHFIDMARAHRNSPGRAEKTRPRVLVVDDQAFFRDLLVPIIEAAGYTPTAAASAREALALCANDAAFQALLVDTDMPEMDGYELTRVLRRDPHHLDLPVIGLAGHASEALQRRAQAAGMQGVVAKFDRGRLLDTLAQELARRSAAVGRAGAAA